MSLKIEKKKVQKTVEVEEEVFTLELSRRQAETLGFILRKIGGPIRASRRADLNKIGDELNEYFNLWAFDLDPPADGAIYFKEGK